MELTARFSEDVKTIRAAALQELANGSGPTVTVVSNNDGTVSVTGSRQAVMFLIGRVASYGHDGLLSVVLH